MRAEIENDRCINHYKNGLRNPLPGHRIFVRVNKSKQHIPQRWIQSRVGNVSCHSTKIKHFPLRSSGASTFVTGFEPQINSLFIIKYLNNKHLYSFTATDLCMKKVFIL
jgi:hypothetical protein